tara:strand:+ start:3214 stop:4683 length:1470 start_codon:yes stop_codon:yes gene_type:complete
VAINVVELFAGVGGFRLGLEGEPGAAAESEFRVSWANQWEPSVKKQHAAEIYAHHWGMEYVGDGIYISKEGDVLSNQNIQNVQSNDIPDHDVLCGGFPCQDYSVARTISGELGIDGEKGKLWTSIHRILVEKANKSKIVFLENVPRLLNSPASKRGLNFSKIVIDLLNLGYSVEWRVINAAEYGFPQKRKRVFILAYLNSEVNSPLAAQSSMSQVEYEESVYRWLSDDSIQSAGPFSRAFPCSLEKKSMKLEQVGIKEYNKNKSPFQNTGYAWMDHHGMAWSYSGKAKSRYDGTFSTLGDAVEQEVDSSFYVTDEEKLRKYRYIKGEQKEWRIRKPDKSSAQDIDAGDGRNLWEYYQELTNGYDTLDWAKSFSSNAYKEGIKQKIVYHYSAGAMAYPDLLQNPSRTIITAEVGTSVSRTRHIIEPEKETYRRLTPVELEKLNGFPRDWTGVGKVSDSRRGFLMGNALVIGVVRKLAGPLADVLLRGPSS